MKYLVVKALLGFGDRLQSLKMCVKYALDHNLQIYVDWTDQTWSHGSESFYTYFKLVNMPVLNSLDDIPANAKIFPAFWQGKLKTILTPEMMIYDIDLGLLAKSYDCEVLVASCNGYRTVYNDSQFFANVFRVIHPEILQNVKQRQQQYDLSKKWGVHLRGTDRALKLDKAKRLSSLVVKMVNSGLLNGANPIAVSDDLDYITLWKARFSQFPVLTTISNLSAISGNHNISKEALNVSKNTLNIDMLVDFFTLASCSNIFSTSLDSRFAQEARRFRPHISQICGA